jgi:serine/threonine-protein kinase
VEKSRAGEADPVAKTPGDTGAGRAARSFEFATRCRVIRKIADGGMASVYLAEQMGESGFAKTVALKVIRRDRLRDERTVRLFVDEAKLVADLVHQNILQVYNLAQYKGLHFIVMEFLHGLTARDFLERHRERERLIPVDLAAFIASRVARALAYAHDKRDRKGRPLGIVHRDVTTSNIMLDHRGFVKLSDFGIAKALTMSIPDETRVIMGKFPYMSPEQARGEKTSPRSDLFSLGVVLYELLTGAKPYEPTSRRELLRLFDEADVPSPTELRPIVPEELSRIVGKAISLDQADRFASAREFGDALEVYMYSSGYGPTNEKMADYLHAVFPEADRDRIE